MKTDTTTTKADATTAPEGRESMIFYASYLRAIKQLPGRQRMALLEAIVEYCIEGKQPVETLKGASAAVFLALQPALDLQRGRTLDQANGTRRNGGRAGAPKGNCNNPYGRSGKRTSGGHIADEDDGKESASPASPAKVEATPDQAEDVAPACQSIVKDDAMKPADDPPKQIHPADRIVCPGLTFRQFFQKFTETQDIPSALAITTERLHSLTREIMNEWAATSSSHSDYASTARHFYYHLRRKIDAPQTKARGTAGISPALAEGKRRWEAQREQERRERDAAYVRPKVDPEKIASIMRDLGVRKSSP